MKRSISALTFILASLALAAPREARAADDDKGDDGGGSVEFGAGVLAVFGGNFISKPSDKTLEVPGIGRAQTESYPGFGGLTLGGGLMFDLRFINLLGLEVDVLRTKDKGSGDITFNNVTKVTVTLEQSAWHVPVLAKVVIPSPIVRPMFFLGPEFVFPSGEKASSDPSSGALLDAEAGTYTMITFGGGVEIKLPLPALDLRIPIALRGSVNPSTSDKLEDRVDAEFAPGTATITKLTYNSEWQYQALMTVGVAAYF